MRAFKRQQANSKGAITSPSYSLYDNCDELTLGLFEVCYNKKDYKVLQKNPKDKVPDEVLQSAWKKIHDEYTDLSMGNSFEFKNYIEMQCALLRYSVQAETFKPFTELLAMGYNPVLIELINGMGYDEKLGYNFSATDKEAYLRDVAKFRLHMLQVEIDIQHLKDGIAKFEKNNAAKSRGTLNFDDSLASITAFFHTPMNKHQITVSQYHSYLRLLIAANERAQRKTPQKQAR